jgi:hypothetical protein
MKHLVRRSKRSKVHVGPRITFSFVKHNKKESQSRGNGRARRDLSTLSQNRVPDSTILVSGRWSKSECVAFDRGIQIYGKGNWTQIATLIPTRYVKRYALKID